MGLIEVNKNPTKNDLRWFGVIVLAFWGLLGGVLIWRFQAWSGVVMLWIPAIVVTGIYYAVPALRKPLFLGWMYAVFPIGWMISFLIMTVTFYLILAPCGMLLRLFRVKLFDPQPDPKATSYWVPHESAADHRRYFQQF